MVFVDASNLVTKHNSAALPSAINQHWRCNCVPFTGTPAVLIVHCRCCSGVTVAPMVRVGRASRCVWSGTGTRSDSLSATLTIELEPLWSWSLSSSSSFKFLRVPAAPGPGPGGPSPFDTLGFNRPTVTLHGIGMREA
jgi:hypothetical protein